jgi:hypothetical protein
VLDQAALLHLLLLLLLLLLLCRSVRGACSCRCWAGGCAVHMSHCCNLHGCGCWHQVTPSLLLTSYCMFDLQ